MSSFAAEYFMRLKGDKRNRPEQMLIYEVLGYHLKYEKLETEYTVTYYTEFHDYRDADLDIYLVMDGVKYAIRVMGGYHKNKTQRKKDGIQQAYLERDGYIVIDLWYDKMPITFLRNKRLLNKTQLMIAYQEIVTEGKILKLPPQCDQDWLKKNIHLKK